MKPPFRLVPDDLSTDTIACLQQLLSMAENGEIHGLAFVALVKGRRFIRNSAGECDRNPLYTRGLVAALDDHLKDKMSAS